MTTSSYILPYASSNSLFTVKDVIVDKADFPWLDIEKLSADFPQRVKIVGNAVSFLGGVCLIPPESASQFFRRKISIIAFMGLCSLGLLYIFKVGLIVQKLLTRRENKRSYCKSPLFVPAINVIGALAVAGITYAATRHLTPRMPRVLFFKSSASQEPLRVVHYTKIS